MKCYVHRDVDAIGVCSRCGQGVCDSCAVRIGGKLYCKEDADKVFSPRPKVEVRLPGLRRPVRIVTVSIAFFLYGFFGVAVGLVFFAAGFATGLVSSIPVASSMALASIGLLGFGGVMLVMGILGLMCGYWLFRMQKIGAVGGFPLLLGGIAIATLLLAMFPVLLPLEITVTVWFVNVFLLILLINSWSLLGESDSSDSAEE